MTIEYKYNEDIVIKELSKYIDKTYNQHYSQNKYQATEFIIDSGHGEGFCIGNILKYAQRYGRKGDIDEWRQDLLKVIHYSIIAIYNHDLKYGVDNGNKDLSRGITEAKAIHSNTNVWRAMPRDVYPVDS
jgi:hypothetical protein